MTKIQYSNRISEVRHQLASRQFRLASPEGLLGTQDKGAIAASLTQQHGIVFDQDDLELAKSPFEALSAAVIAVSDPGDEVIVIGGDLFYTTLVSNAGVTPTVVGFDRENGSLDLRALARAMNAKVRAVIVDRRDPVWLSSRAIAELARVLLTAANIFGRPVFLIVDETVNAGEGVEAKGRMLVSASSHTFVVGGPAGVAHVAVPATMPDRHQWAPAIDSGKAILGRDRVAVLTERQPEPVVQLLPRR